MNEKNRKDLFDHLKKCNPKQLDSTIQCVSGKASDDGLAYTKDKATFMGPDAMMRSVTLISSRLCDCGKLVSQDNSLLGKCSNKYCKRLTCSSCARVCRYCGDTFCHTHSRHYNDGTVYCLKCRYVKWLKIFFAIKDKKEKD